MAQSSSIPRMHRPAGIWISTVYAGLVFGLLPIFYLLQNLLLPGQTTFEILPDLVTPLLIILSACLVWAGREDARFWFLVILTLYAYATGIAIAVLFKVWFRSSILPAPNYRIGDPQFYNSANLLRIFHSTEGVLSERGMTL